MAQSVSFFAQPYFMSVVLMSIRLGALLMTAPIFGARNVPAPTKIGLAVALALVLAPIAPTNTLLPTTEGGVVAALVKEMIVGMMAGFAVTLVFASLQVASSLAGIQIGFGFSSTVDPNFTGNSSALDHLFTALGTLIFLTGNFHHQVLIGVQALFNSIPVNGLSLTRLSPEGLIGLSADMFMVAARIVFPLLGALLLTELALGVLARTAPQINVFFVGMPVKIAVGVYAVAVMMPFMTLGVEKLFASTARDLAFMLNYR